MKKVFLLLLLTMSVWLTAKSEPVELVATEVAYKFSIDDKWSSWIECDIPIIIDAEEKHIEIFSQKTQIIDHDELLSSKYDWGTLFTGYGSDTDYQLIKIEIFLYDKGSFYLKITDYKNRIEYKYRVPRKQ